MAGYADGRRGGVRLLKDLDLPVEGRDVLLVEDVVDTGLTLAFLTRTLWQRRPASVSAVTLLDRPYRRLVENIGLRYVGYTVPDELFAGYGLGLEERWRALPDLRSSPPRHCRPPRPTRRRGRRRSAASTGREACAVELAVTGTRADRRPPR